MDWDKKVNGRDSIYTVDGYSVFMYSDALKDQ